MKLSRALALLALMTLPTMVVSAFAQQETTPLPKPVAKKETKVTMTDVAQHNVKKTVRDQAQRHPERVQAMLTTK